MKGQTAMEYLMTYGWAILIVIVVVAALYSMGVFRLSGGVACSPCFGYFAFVDYSQTAGTIRVRNGPRTIEIGSADSTPAGASTTDCPVGTPCSSGANIDITGVPNTAADPTVVVTITYTDTESGLSHTDSGTIHNK
jgi:hypothetical protein